MAIDSIQLKMDIAAFNKAKKHINEKRNLIVGTEVESAFDTLKEHYRNGGFEPTEMQELVMVIKSNLNKFGGDRSLQTELKKFATCCEVYYTKDEESFFEFQKAMGGRIRQPVVVNETFDPEEQARKKRERLDELRRQQQEQSSHTETRTSNTNGGKRKNRGCLIFILLIGFLMLVNYNNIISFFTQQLQTQSHTDKGNIKKDEIIGVWKGTYTENGTGGKGNLTLTINDDMTGVFETSITNRQSKSRSIKATFTVFVTNSNGNYSVRGKEWISLQPNDYSFDDLDGTVSNGIFSGRNFKLEKTTVTEAQNVFPFLGRWKLTGKDSYYNWTADLVIEEKNGNKFSGYFDWYRSGNYAGKEYYQGEYNSYNRTVIMKGSRLVNAKNLALGTYEAYLNNQNFESGKWGGSGTTSGTWQAVFLNKSTSIEPKKVEPKKEDKLQQPTDYSAKVETALSNAINAFDDGRFRDAFNYYIEAANYPTDRSSAIKQNAAKKFKEKAERLISNNNGECDELTKQLLQYANSLYSTSEIQNLLNRCGGSISGVSSSNSSRFPQASQRLLSASDLRGLSKSDLGIMRNEIFARHGYIFTTSKWKNYFSNQSWYTPRYSDVNSLLSNIEQQNIALIKRYE